VSRLSRNRDNIGNDENPEGNGATPTRTQPDTQRNRAMSHAISIFKKRLKTTLDKQCGTKSKVNPNRRSQSGAGQPITRGGNIQRQEVK